MGRAIRSERRSGTGVGPGVRRRIFFTGVSSRAWVCEWLDRSLGAPCQGAPRRTRRNGPTDQPPSTPSTPGQSNPDRKSLLLLVDQPAAPGWLRGRILIDAENESLAYSASLAVELLSFLQLSESMRRASSTVAGSRPMSRAMRTALATRSPLEPAICVPAASR